MSVLFDPRLPERFWDKVSPEPNAGCWLWVGAQTTNGYGSFHVRLRAGKQHVDYAHRLVFEIANGAASPGLELDHLCCTPCCCNPDHLEAVTHSENIQRGFNKKKGDRCPHGHPRTPENTYRNGGRATRCRVCTLAAQTAAYARKVGKRKERQ